MKKIISFALCILLLFANVSLIDAYADNSAMQIMQALDVIQGDPDGNLRENDLVKRSEFAKMAVLLSEFKNKLSLNSKISVFTDCTSDHWAAPYVRVAAENGIIEGYSNGVFGPDDYISYAQAVTIALRLLGYTDEDFGNTYPEGQLGMASSLKLGDGVSKTRDELITRYDVAQIFKNMLLTSKKDSNNDYIETLNFSIKEDTVVIATNDEDAAVAPGKVYTTNGEYTIDESFNKELIGKKGSAVINSENKLVTLIDNGGQTLECAVYAVGGDFISAYGGGKLLTISCDDATLSYNGIEKTTFSSLRSNLSTGDIIIWGKDAYGNTDYLIAVRSGFDGPYTIREDGKIPLNDDYSSYFVLKNGSNSSLSEIKKYDIVYISKSLSGIFAYSKKVSGIYSKAVPNIDSPQSVIVGGKEYKIETPLAFSKLSSGGNNNIGDTVVLLLGRDGGIADIMDNEDGITDNYLPELKQETDTMDKTYALLLALGAIDNGDTEKTVTRGEFAKMAVMSSSYRNLVSHGLKLAIFADCLPDNPYTPYIKLASEKKLMSAHNDSLFYPDKPISLAEALDASLKIIGYSDTDFSEWPSSQISIAKQKGITDGINKSAYDEISFDEAVTIIYNTLVATNKSGTIKGIEMAGFNYYDDAVLIATNSENTSVPSGKLLTSVGTFSIDENNFDHSLVGKTGELLVHSGKVQMFNKYNGMYTQSIVYSAIPGGLSIAADNGSANISVSDTTPVYINASKTNFGKASSSIAVGDTVYMCYDNSSRLKYIYIDSSLLDGPFVVNSPSGWYVKFSGASPDSKIMKNGSEITSSMLINGDVIYYAKSLDTAFVYNTKVIGILEDATPSKDAPDTVKVSGNTYTIETGGVSFASSDFGDTVVLSLGRNGKVANGSSTKNEKLSAYLTQTGVKSFTNSNGESYTSNYARLVLADGTEIDCATDSNYNSWVNKIMQVTFTDGKAKLSMLTSPGTVSGTVDAKKMLIGSSKLSSDIKILDIGYIENGEAVSYKSVYIQRLDGIGISPSDVLSAKLENGYITELILNNVTGDALSYGIITQANSNVGTNKDGSYVASGSYTCDIGGSSYSYSGGAYTNITKGSAVSAVISGGRVASFKKLDANKNSVKEINYTHAVLSNGTKLTLADDVTVYKRGVSYDYTHLPLSEIVDNSSKYSNISVYTDNTEAKGGRVRIIIVR